MAIEDINSKIHEGNDFPKLLPECNQIFINLGKDNLDLLKKIEELKLDLNEKLAQLIDRADKINGRYDKHLEESVVYRIEVEKHKLLLDGIKDVKKLWFGVIFTIFMASLSLAVTWGITLNKISQFEKYVSQTEERINKLERIEIIRMKDNFR